MAAAAIGTTAADVREQHGRQFRRLRRQLSVHRPELNDDGWALLTRAAFALYLDSLDPASTNPRGRPRELVAA